MVSKTLQRKIHRCSSTTKISLRNNQNISRLSNRICYYFFLLLNKQFWQTYNQGRNGNQIQDGRLKFNVATHHLPTY